MSSAIIGATASQLLSGMDAGDWTAVDVATAFLDQIQTHDDRIKAFLHVDRAEALRQAEAVDQKRRQRQPLGRLAGLPIAAEGRRLHARPTDDAAAAASSQNFVPPYDAEIVRRLREADAVLIGKTNMDEFAMGSSTENSAYQDDAQSLGHGTSGRRVERRFGRRRGGRDGRPWQSAATPAVRSASRRVSAASSD